MSTTSKRSIVVNFIGDFDADNSFSALDNETSPAQTQFVTLVPGDNSYTPPADSTALTVIFPAGNQTLVILKGDAADVGIELHKTDPSSVAINDPANAVILNAATTIDEVRLIWS